MNRLSPVIIRVIVGVVVVSLVVTGLVYALSGGNQKIVSANFSSAVGVYPGTPVKIMGINVGDVTKVKPDGDHVRVTMEYGSQYKVRDNVVALMVANSLVSDRFIQLEFKNTGALLKNHATIPLSRTASPAELDDIYAALNKLSVALGTKGANSNGALSRFIAISQANLQGNGAAFGQSISKLAAAAKTLSDSRSDLFGTVKNLQSFTNALASSDSQIRKVEEELAQVSADLAAERGDLGAALHNLANALDQVGTFVKTNASKTHTDLQGLSNIARILVKEQASLNETLAVGPAALANIVHAYQPDLGVIASRGNLASLLDPGSICDALNILDFGGLLGDVTKTLSDLLSQFHIPSILGSSGGDIASTCRSLIVKKGGTKLPAGMTQTQAKSLLNSLLVGQTQLGGLLPGS